MQSALSNPGPVDKYIQQEVLAGRVVQLPEEWGLQISRFGIIPNSNQPGRWRVVIPKRVEHK